MYNIQKNLFIFDQPSRSQFHLKEAPRRLHIVAEKSLVKYVEKQP